MKILIEPPRYNWEKLQRPEADHAEIEKKVEKIIDAVRKKGDKAVKKFSKEFDGVKLKTASVSDEEWSTALSGVDEKLANAIQVAAENIRKFHQAQLRNEERIETTPGIVCWRKNLPIEKVGLYIPGGSAPLFSTVLMLGIPANISGCKKIVLCTPPSPDGSIHPAILYAAKIAGITQVFKVGGVQAIAAMAFGTKEIPAVYKIFGPGNQFVTVAKQLVQKRGIAIDFPAGPSELLVYADRTANAAWVASDMLAQAEHGPDSQVICIVSDEMLVSLIEAELQKQIFDLPRKKIIEKALDNSFIIVLNNKQHAIDLINEYAPEHLILACQDAPVFAYNIYNAGSVFIGEHTPESIGDYASGTNHTLPTNRNARAFAGISVDSFMKKITFQQATPEGLEEISETVITMAEAEGLYAHANSVRIRINE